LGADALLPHSILAVALILKMFGLFGAAVELKYDKKSFETIILG